MAAERRPAQRLPGVAAWIAWAAVLLAIPLMIWLDNLSHRAGRPDLTMVRPRTGPPLLALVSAATVGAVLVSRRPRHPVGWLLLTYAMLFGVNGVATAYTNYALLAGPVTPWTTMIARYPPLGLYANLICAAFILLLTPTGALPSPRWRGLARVAALSPAAVLIIVAVLPEPVPRPYRPAEDPLDLRGFGPVLRTTYVTALAVGILIAAAAAAAMVIRFRRARGVERQQLRWVALAAAAVLPVAPVVLAAVAAGQILLAVLVGGWCVALLPLSIGAAILRYRLYDLDRIISRTVAYALLTVALGATYGTIALGLGAILGRRSTIAVAVATLVVAGMFHPARSRIQDLVDRRFNRRRYDKARTIEAFTARLRDQVDLDTLQSELLAVVDQTMQPTRSELWLRHRDSHA
jgi:hypothetical protein